MSIDLSSKHCEACEGMVSALNAEQIQNLMPQLDAAWALTSDGKALKREFAFKDFYQTMAFMNLLAWVANTENHHPDVELGYNYCHVRFNTHAVAGITQNDFICAAKVDRLF